MSLDYKQLFSITSSPYDSCTILQVFWNHKDYHWMKFLTHSYRVASEDSKYSSWVICTTFMVLFCPFWSSTDFDGIYFVLWRRAGCTFCWTSCILCSVKERIQVWDDITWWFNVDLFGSFCLCCPVSVVPSRWVTFSEIKHSTHLLRRACDCNRERER